MPYLGVAPNPRENREVDDISSSFNGSNTAFTLQSGGSNVSPGKDTAIIVSLGGVVQNPGTDYTIAASTITFTTAPASGLSFFGVVLAQSIDIETVADNTVTTAKIVDGAVTNAKVNASAAIAGTKISPDFGSQAISTTNDSVTIGDSIIHSGDTNTKIRFPAANQFTVETGGSQRMSLSSSGMIFNETGEDVDFRIEGVNEANLFHVDANNNRIGMFTSIPDSQFHLKGNTNADVKIKSQNANTGTSARAGVIVEAESATLQLFASSANYSGVSGWSDSGIITTGSGASGGLILNSQASGGVIKFQIQTGEKLRIDNAGRLLVGTTTARTGFAFTASAAIQTEGTHQQGSISSTNTENNSNTCAFVSAKIRGSGAVANNDIVGAHVFEGFDGTAFRRIARIDGIARNSGSGISNNVISGDLAFYTRIDGSLEQEVVRFNHQKLALFGTSSIPTASQEGVSIDCDPSDLPVFIKTSSKQHGGNAYTHYQMFTANGLAGNILCSGTTTSYNSGSDYRLKENETPITDGIVRLKQLKPYKFNWKHSPSADKVDGFFAHEVSSVVPEAISGEKDAVATEANVKSGLAENVGDMLTQQIDQSKLVPLLVAAVQELIGKVEALEAA
mgnify:FL=1